jgi:hypothetical protein
MDNLQKGQGFSLIEKSKLAYHGLDSYLCLDPSKLHDFTLKGMQMSEEYSYLELRFE